MDNVIICKVTPVFNEENSIKYKVYYKINNLEILQNAQTFTLGYRIFPYCIYNKYVVTANLYAKRISIIELGNNLDVTEKFLNTPIIIFNCPGFTEEMCFEMDHYINNLLNSSNNE